MIVRNEEFVSDGYNPRMVLDKPLKEGEHVTVIINGRELKKEFYSLDKTSGTVLFVTGKEKNPFPKGTHIEIEVSNDEFFMPFGKYARENIKKVDLEYLCWFIMATTDQYHKKSGERELLRRGYTFTDLVAEWDRLIGIGIIDPYTGYRDWERISEMTKRGVRQRDLRINLLTDTQKIIIKQRRDEQKKRDKEQEAFRNIRRTDTVTNQEEKLAMAFGIPTKKKKRKVSQPTDNKPRRRFGNRKIL